MVSESITVTSSRFSNWVVVPFNGIAIQDESAEPMLIFGDATLLAPSEIKRFDEWCSTGEIEEDEIKNFRMHLRGFSSRENPKPDAFIVVGVYGEGKETYVKGLARAEHIAATLCVIMLYYENCKYNCKLHGDLAAYPASYHFGISSTKGIIAQTENYFSTKSHIVRTDGQFLYARQEVIELVTRPHVRALGQTLWGASDSLASDLRESLDKSVRQVYLTHDALTPEVQLVGSITAMEVLFGAADDGNSKGYDKVKERIKWFAQSSGAYGALSKKENIFHWRRAHIHGAKSVPTHIAASAVRLAVSVLLRYAEYAQNFKRLSELNMYIDVARSLNNYSASTMSELLIRWSSVPEDHPSPDMFRSFLLNEFYGERSGVQVPNPPTREEKFATATLIIEQVYKVERTEAFEQACQYVLRSVPFQNYEELNNYIQSHSHCEKNAQKWYAQFEREGEFNSKVPG